MDNYIYHRSINYILSKLKVLAKLQSGQKLIVNDSNIEIYECEKNNWDRFVKWWLGETRYKTIDKLQGFYLEIKDIIFVLLSDIEKNAVALERLSVELNSGIRGLENLMLTYQHDQTVVSQLETLSENFKLEMQKVNEAVKQIEENKVEPENMIGGNYNY